MPPYSMYKLLIERKRIYDYLTFEILPFLGGDYIEEMNLQINYLTYLISNIKSN